MHLSPSILAADMTDLKSILPVLEGQVDFLHMDVMDGHFVPTLSFGEMYTKTIAKHTSIPLDVHLMVTNPEAEVPKYFDIKPANITFHVETTAFGVRLAGEIRKHGIRAGVSLNPATSLSTLDHLLDYIDLVLIMSVEPGFYGQSFLPLALDKIRELKRRIGGRPITIEVVAGTLVKVHPDTPNSRQIKGESCKEIDQLRIGDLVLSANEHTGELSYRPVTELFVHDMKLIHRLTYKEGLTVETAWNHPFWVHDKGWTEAKDLHAGERSVTARSILKQKQPKLQTVSFTSKVQPGFDDPSMLTWDDAREGTLSVARVEEVHRADKVYNIEVEGNHTYFVTEEGVLVHNYDTSAYNGRTISLRTDPTMGERLRNWKNMFASDAELALKGFGGCRSECS